jgi:hypothetical protein
MRDNGSLALGTFQLESISHKDLRTRFERKTCVTIAYLKKQTQQFQDLSVLWNEPPLSHLLTMSCEKRNCLPEAVTSYRSRTLTPEERFHGRLFLDRRKTFSGEL